MVGNDLHGLKVKHLHVGGILESGKVHHGLEGCIQVSPSKLLCILVQRWAKHSEMGNLKPTKPDDYKVTGSSFFRVCAPSLGR